MKTFVRKNLNYIVFLIILILLITLKAINPSFIKSVSYLSFDLYQKIFVEEKDTDVIIIDIDESSLGKFGQFPWSRSVFAKILDQLNTSNPKAIGFDIFFTEKDKQSPEEIIKSYDLIPSDVADLQKLKGHDDLFAEKLKESKSITAVLGSNVPSHTNYDRKAKAKFLSKGGDPKKFTYSYPYSIGSLEKLEKNVKNFHIQFLLKLTKFFGFQISDSSQITKAYLNKKEQNDFVMDCISMNYNSKIHSNYSERNDVLNSLIIYFSQSLGVNIKLKSLQVLKEVFTPV